MPAVISDAAFSYSEVKVRGRYQLYNSPAYVSNCSVN